MFLKHTRRRKFTELMTDHVLSDENGIKSLSVVHQKRVADKIRCHHRTPRPRFDRFLCARTVHLVDLFQKMRLDEGSFLQRSSHKLQVITYSPSSVRRVSDSFATGGIRRDERGAATELRFLLRPSPF